MTGEPWLPLMIDRIQLGYIQAKLVAITVDGLVK